MSLSAVVYLTLSFVTSACCTESTEVAGFSPGYSYASNPLTLTTLAPSGHRMRTNATIAESELPNVTFPTNASIIIDDGECTGKCDELPAQCLTCNSSNNCRYGERKNFTCKVNNGYECIGSRVMEKEFLCVYCYLTKAGEEHECVQSNTTCKVASTPRQRVKMTCTVNDDVYCLGKRNFTKLAYCNWTSGYKWSTAMILSVTLGGFGVDRFYLGYWKEGLGKLFSFGGLGVWTLIDIVLIGTSYLGPADGSLYIT